MMRVMLAWELGANLGHVAPLRMVAQHLQLRGHTCTFAARDLDSAEEFLEPALGPVMQAPIRLSNGRNPVRTQVSYTSLLNNTGFDHIVGLAGRLRAWRQLLQDTGAGLLIADHSPTALLAARTLGLSAVHLGTGFTVPPLTQPFRVFHPGLQVPPKILEHNERAVLSNANAALDRLQLAPLAALQDMFSSALSFITSFSELDHYDGTRAEPYIGLPDCAHGIDPPWPAGDGRKVFAYLRPAKNLELTLTALSRLPARVLVRIGGINPARLKSFERPGMLILEQPIHMRRAAESCDAFVNYASHGVTAEMLLAGKPGVLLPDTVERSLVARRAVQLGACLTPPAEGDFNLSSALLRTLEDSTLANAAQTFARRYHHIDRAQILPRMTDQALEFSSRPRGA